MEIVWIVLEHPFTKGAFSGALAAAIVDKQAAKSWRSFDEALAYDWKLAAWRWTQGALFGGLAAVGMP